MSWVPINFKLLAHPVNWLVMLLFFLAWGMLADIIVRHYQDAKSSPVSGG